jgi:hypothetical protein
MLQPLSILMQLPGRRQSGFPAQSGSALRFIAAGLSGVEVRSIDIWTVFKDFRRFLVSLPGWSGSRTGLASLNPERLVVLRERIRQALPFAIDGSIPMMAAWAVRGTLR